MARKEVGKELRLKFSFISAASPRTPGNRRRGSTLQLGTLSGRFKASLSLLLGEIRATRPHFVRCLKPNDDLAADRFDVPRLLQQLRYCGVLAAVEVARAG